VLLEHYAGAFPTWLAPEQVRILPIAGEHEDYAQELLTELTRSGFRASIEAATDPLGKRVREAKVKKIPHVLVVGKDDIANRTVGENVRGSENPERDLPFQEFLSRLTNEVEERK